MTNTVRMWVLASAAIMFAAAAPAEKTAEQPELFRKLLDCRTVTDSAQRLACYDAQVGAIDVAQKKRDLVVVDRAQMRETRKSLFGFTMPTFGLFSGHGDKDEKQEKADDISEIDATIASARGIAGGNWSIVLSNDAGTWETVNALDFQPKNGDKVHIKKAALGSYLGSLGYNRGVRFRRVG